MIIIDLIFNLALLVSASVLSGFIDQRWNRNTMMGVVFQGLLFGHVALLGMMNPFTLAPGLIFDGRSVVLSLCGLFFGPVAGFLAASIALIYRLSLGGNGVIMGVSVIISSTLIGVFFHRLTSKYHSIYKIINLYAIGMIVNVVMVLLIFFVPTPMRMVTFQKITLTVLGVYPVATALIGKILKDQADSSGRKAMEEALFESESKFELFMEHLPALAFIKDGESRTVYVNKSMDDVLGASSWVGLTPTEYFSGEPGEKILAEDQAAMQTGYIKIEETRPDRLGNQRIYETQKFIIPMAVKQPLLGGIAIDITERKIAEAALKEKTDELMRFNNLMLGRELKMIELKREINELLEHSGAPSKYKIFD